jgi:class 3 adenylate cyclase/tetratricopeptide (TPR) repeat protein
MITPMDVSAWLSSLGFDQYAQAFAENDIDWNLLIELSDADLKELGIASLGHRQRLLAAIANRTTAASVGEDLGPSTDERREVTILFADLSGFTALSHSLDPEEVRELVTRYTALVGQIVVNYGGTVDKHIGDAVMGLFGAPRAHDDDPLRAARAAIDIHDALAQWSEKEGQRLSAHVGIATGEVIAGALARGADAHDYTVLGSSVNLAARLVGAAGAGETLVADRVRTALAGRCACDALGERQFKGIDAPVRVWRLRGLAGETTPDNRSPFVGREAELDQFRSVIVACVKRRAGQVVYVRGEAGIGKTRLVEEMRRFAEAEGFVTHRGLTLDFGMGRGQDPIRAVVRSLLGLGPAATESERGAAAAQAIADGRVEAERSAFLEDLLDLPPSGEWRALYDAMDNAARNRGKRQVVADLGKCACTRDLTLFVVEDLHWADSLLLGHLAALAAAIAQGPGLLVLTSRVEGDPLDAAWRASCRATPFATIDLGPLRPDEARRLADNFIDATQRVALACIQRAGGHPLFLEQLLRNVEEGSVEAVPSSIQSLVLARMDRLPGRDRLAFQAAAVIGQRFDLPLLRRLISAPDYRCEVLVANALVLPDGESFLFAHALIQEGAYASLLRSHRRELHQVAADWFTGNDPSLRAQHLDRAEDARAPLAYLDAATAQRATYHADSALKLVERGLALARGEAERHALICLKGELLRDVGDIASSIATYREAIGAASSESESCQAQLGLAEGLRFNEGLDEALALLNEAQPVAERHGMVAELARLHHLRGNIFFPLGRIVGCREEHERGLVYAQSSGSAEAEARSLGGLADAAYAQGRMRTAFDYFSRCVALSNQHRFGRIEVANRSMVGFSRVYLNEPREAREDGVAAARAASLVGHLRAELLGETMGVFASYEMGERQATEDHLARATQLARQLGAQRFEAQNLEMRARLALDAGNRQEAERLAREGLAIGREAGLRFCGPKTISLLSRTAEDEAGRLRWLAEGKTLLDEGAVGHNHLWYYRDAIEAMLAADDRAGALHYVAALESYTGNEPLPWAELFASRGRVLARISEKNDECARDELARIQGASSGWSEGFLASSRRGIGTCRDMDWFGGVSCLKTAGPSASQRHRAARQY